MNVHTDFPPRADRKPAGLSPVASERIRALAIRIIEGAPALTAGEMRELARAIIEHNDLSEQDAGSPRATIGGFTAT